MNFVQNSDLVLGGWCKFGNILFNLDNILGHFVRLLINFFHDVIHLVLDFACGMKLVFKEFQLKIKVFALKFVNLSLVDIELTLNILKLIKNQELLGSGLLDWSNLVDIRIFVDDLFVY